MALITNNISGSTSNSSKIGITGSVIIADRPSASFPSLPSDVSFLIDTTQSSVFKGKAVVSGSMIMSGSTVMEGTVTFSGNNQTLTHSGTGDLTIISSNGSVKIEGSTFSGNNLTVPGALTVTTGFSGSLTKLSSGADYLLAGNNISTTTGSTGTVTIAAVPSGNNTQVQFNDSGNLGGNSGLTYNKTTGAITGTYVVASTGFSGSLTKLSSGADYIVAGTNTSIATGSSGNITINVPAGGSNTQIQFNDSGNFGGNVNLTYNKTTGALTGTYLVASTGFSGSLTKLSSGSDYLIAGTNISTTTGSTGNVTISTNIPGSNNQVLTSNGSGGTTAQSNLTFNGSGLTVTGNTVITGDLTVNGTTSTINTTNLEVKDAVIGLGFASGSTAQTAGDRGWIGGISSANNVMMKWDNTASEFMVGRTTSSPSGTLGIASYSNFAASNIQGAIITASLGFSGSLTALKNGNPYMISGPGISITTGSTGAVTVSNTNPNVYFLSTTNGTLYTTGAVAFRGNEAGISSPSTKGTDVFFYVSGSITGSGANDKKSLFGGDVVISGSLRQGFNVSSTGIYSHAQGYQTTAASEGSHAEGRNNSANNLGSHAEGQQTSASGVDSHAEGYQTITLGSYSHAEGYGSISSGEASHAEGVGSRAVGNYSHAEGSYTIASGSGQTVVGKYNLRNNTTSLFVIGNGSGDSNSLRNDIFRVESGSLGGAGNVGNDRVEVTGSLAFTEAFIANYASVSTSPYTATSKDYYLGINVAGSATINLPPPVLGKVINIKVNGTSVTNVTIQTNGAGSGQITTSGITMSGAPAQITMNGAMGFPSVTLQCVSESSNKWHVISQTGAVDQTSTYYALTGSIIGNYTVPDGVTLVTMGSSTTTITLPSASTNVGRFLQFAMISTTGAPKIIVPAGTDRIISGSTLNASTLTLNSSFYTTVGLTCISSTKWAITSVGNGGVSGSI